MYGGREWEEGTQHCSAQNEQISSCTLPDLCWFQLLRGAQLVFPSWVPSPALEMKLNPLDVHSEMQESCEAGPQL